MTPRRTDTLMGRITGEMERIAGELDRIMGDAPPKRSLDELALELRSKRRVTRCRLRAKPGPTPAEVHRPPV